MILRPTLTHTLSARTLRLSNAPKAALTLAQARRSIASTPRRQYATPPGFPQNPTFERLMKTPMWEKLQRSPEALAAADRFGDVLRSHGIETTSGKPPSTMQIAKMFLKPEIRDAVKRLVDTFAKAGIDLKDPELMKQLMGTDKK